MTIDVVELKPTPRNRRNKNNTEEWKRDHSRSILLRNHHPYLPAQPVGLGHHALAEMIADVIGTKEGGEYYGYL